MTGTRIQHDARTLLASAVEEELDRLRRARPNLEARVDRAAGLLVLQLSGGPRMRPIRVRTNATRARFLVASLSSGGVTYEVDPKGWTCSCPDYHRRGQACKHVAACFVLWKVDRPDRPRRASARANPQKGCDACRDNPGWVLVEEEVVDAQTGEVSTAHNPIKCRRCQPAEPGVLTDQEMEEWMARVPWREATTYAPPHDHSYTLRRLQDPDYFDKAARTVWWHGFDRWYLRRPWRTLHVGDFILWLHTRPQSPRHPFPTDTVVINRVEAAKARVV